MAKEVVVHTVLITFYTGTPEEKRREILARFAKLGEECGGVNAGILGWAVKSNLDLSKKKHVSLMQAAIFEDVEAFQAFRAHDKHARLRNELRELADWISGDIVVERSGLKQVLKNI